MKELYAKIMPFFMLGIGFAALFYGLMLLAYLFVFGAVVGLVLFVIAWIKAKFRANKRSMTAPKRRGRIIEHED